MILDRETHRPQRLPDSITQREWPAEPAQEPQWTNFEDNKELKHITPDFDVRLNEIDINNHVNNAHYLAWAMNAATPHTYPTWLAIEAEVIFDAESKLGDTIRIESGFHATGNVMTSTHHVHRVEPPNRVNRVNILWVRNPG
jgi:medium-chain acyl-[acyl-carrier-protein] hydrolase